MYLEASGFDVTERAVVLSTSGNKASPIDGHEVTEIRNSYRYADLKSAMIAQWKNSSFAERDKRKGHGQDRPRAEPHRHRQQSYGVDDEDYDEDEFGDYADDYEEEAYDCHAFGRTTWRLLTQTESRTPTATTTSTTATGTATKTSSPTRTWTRTDNSWPTRSRRRRRRRGVSRGHAGLWQANLPGSPEDAQ